MWDPSAADIADYIRIRVGHGLTPSKATLLLGTVQQFSTSVISEGTIRNQSKQKKRYLYMSPPGINYLCMSMRLCSDGSLFDATFTL